MMSTSLKIYTNDAVPEAAKLLIGDDTITFSVLVNILHGVCTKTVTDHESFILCYSTSPYPVWVWCKNEKNTETVKNIAAALRTHFPAEKEFRWNMTHTLFEALKSYDPHFEPLSTAMGLLSYRMDELLPVTHPADGKCDHPTQEEVSLLCKLWHDACLEMEGFDHNEDFCRARVKAYMEQNNLFIWRTAEGEIAAITSRRDTAPFSKVATVYTVPKHRRHGYAMNLVHAVSKGMLKDGLTPILYTDANYAASNACYKKIGYREVDALCCVGKK